MKPYTNVLRNILVNGERSDNRTGIDTIMLPGQSMQFNMREGFPLLGLRKVPYTQIFGELIGFMRGFGDAESFREFGCNIWDANANSNKAWLANPFRIGDDDLGLIYGVQWRGWEATTKAHDAGELAYLTERGWSVATGPGSGADHWTLTKVIDQLADCLEMVRNDPTNRRILFHAWNPANLHAMALPPCHLLYQFHCYGTDKISLTVYIRSNDMGLGAPFNIASSATLLSLFAAWSGRTPHLLTIHIGDAHIYVNHLDAVSEMLLREDQNMTPELPVLGIAKHMVHTDVSLAELLQDLLPQDLTVSGYRPLGALKMEMAV